MQICIRNDRQRPSELETLCREIGHQWPPRSPAEATTILNKAGTFTPTEVRQFLNTVGYTGFESYGELEDGLIRTGKPDFYDGDRPLTAEEHTAKFFDPTFTSTLLDGLRDYVAKFRQRRLHKVPPVETEPAVGFPVYDGDTGGGTDDPRVQRRYGWFRGILI